LFLGFLGLESFPLALLVFFLNLRFFFGIIFDLLNRLLHQLFHLSNLGRQLRHFLCFLIRFPHSLLNG